MDIFGLIIVPMWLVLLFVLLLLLSIYSAYQKHKLTRMGLPGPTPVPFLGNLIPIYRKGMNVAPLDWVRQYGGIFGTGLGHVPVVWVSDVDLLKRIFVEDFSTFTNRGQLIEGDEPLNSSIFLVLSEHWKFMRSVLTPTFSSGKLREMIPMMQRCCDVLVEHVTDQGTGGKSLEMKRLFGGFTMDVICSTAFGIEVDSQKNPDDPFVKRAEKIFNNTTVTNPIFLLVFLFPEVRHYLKYLPFRSFLDGSIVKFFNQVTTDALTERRKEGSNRRDFLQLMLNAHKEPSQKAQDNDDDTEETHIQHVQDFSRYKHRGLTDIEILGNAMFFFVAGYDTTATTLNFTSYFLATKPDIQEKVIEEVDRVIGTGPLSYENIQQLEYMDMVISETLRHYSPVTLLQRSPSSDVTLGGFQIPMDTVMIIPVLAIHKNPDLWPNPEKFDPDRFTKENQSKRHPMAFLPFGTGPRNCIGMRLAKLEAKMALTAILQRFRFVVAPETEIPPKLDQNITLTRAINGLWIRFESR